MGWSPWGLLVEGFEGVLPGVLLQAPPPTAAPTHQPDFQPYVFFAYGAACFLLLLFTLWTAGQSRRLAARIKYLEERLDRAHPGVHEGAKGQ